jgi:hypothetical protein
MVYPRFTSWHQATPVGIDGATSARRVLERFGLPWFNVQRCAAFLSREDERHQHKTITKAISRSGDEQSKWGAFASLLQSSSRSSRPPTRKRETSVMCSLKICHYLVAALCVLGPLTCVAHGGNINGEATYISFSVPGALGTYPMSINASMAVTGYYYVAPTVARGFLREADGTFTTFDVAGGIWTEPEGINAAGDTTGFYQLPAGVPQGFSGTPKGRFIIFDPPHR